MNQLKIVNNTNTNDSNIYLVKKTDIEKNIADHDHANYITTQEFNTFTSENFDARVAQANYNKIFINLKQNIQR